MIWFDLKTVRLLDLLKARIVGLEQERNYLANLSKMSYWLHHVQDFKFYRRKIPCVKIRTLYPRFSVQKLSLLHYVGYRRFPLEQERIKWDDTVLLFCAPPTVYIVDKSIVYVVVFVQSSCFICGIGKDYFDKLPHGFEIHVKNEHNFANYMSAMPLPFTYLLLPLKLSSRPVCVYVSERSSLSTLPIVCLFHSVKAW